MHAPHAPLTNARLTQVCLSQMCAPHVCTPPTNACPPPMHQVGEELVGRLVDGLHGVGALEQQQLPPMGLVVHTWATFFRR